MADLAEYSLTQKQVSVLRAVASQSGFLSAWCLGTATCEALRKRGLVRGSGDGPFRGGCRDNGDVYITDAGRAALEKITEKTDG